jgi:hypothetical protein
MRKWWYLLKPNLKRWYPSISIWWKRLSIHRLVAKAFIPNPENKPEVDHINNDKSDFMACNLQWVTRKENMKKYYTWRVIEWFWKWKKMWLHPKSKRILQESKLWLPIKEWENILCASKELWIDQSTISRACNNKRATAWWFIWKFV